MAAQMLRSERPLESYLGDLPPLRSSPGPAGPPPERLPAPDASRYRLDPPADPRDLEAWKAAALNARAQLEHQRARLVNLELLQHRGEELWREENRRLEAAGSAAARELAEEQRRSEATNRERKLQQLAAGSELRRLEAEWYSQVSRNMDLDCECRALEREVELLRAQLPAPGAGGAGSGARAGEGAGAGPEPEAGAEGGAGGSEN